MWQKGPFGLFLGIYLHHIFNLPQNNHWKLIQRIRFRNETGLLAGMNKVSYLMRYTIVNLRPFLPSIFNYILQLSSGKSWHTRIFVILV